jgi:uncharacterized Rossmann fold enzyme
VYNGADPDAQKVVLAHDLGPAADSAIERYYSDRLLWHITVTGVDSDHLAYTAQRLER